MGAPRRLSLSDLGRPSLFLQVRIEVPPNAGLLDHRWEGPRAEMEADTFLRTLPLRGPPGAWAWMVRIHLVLEDRTPLTAHLPLRAGLPAPTVRAAAVAGLHRAANDLDQAPGRRGEARRVLELLTGEPFRYEAAPDFQKMYQQCLQVVERAPGPTRKRAAKAAPPPASMAAEALLGGGAPAGSLPALPGPPPEAQPGPAAAGGSGGPRRAAAPAGPGEPIEPDGASFKRTIQSA